MNDQAPTVFVVDDDAALRKALVRLLRAAEQTVETFESAQDFFARLPPDRPGCLVLDVRMPGMSGLELQEALAARGRSWPVIFLTGHGDIPMSVKAMKAGAADFLTKPVKGRVLLEAVAAAFEADRRARASRATRDELAARLGKLSPREREVFDHVVRGRLNKQIALLLGTTERTVKAHRANVMAKMRVGSLAELVQAADLLGLTGAPTS